MAQCILCNKNTAFLFPARDHANLNSDVAWNLDWCARCAFGRLRGDFSPETIASFYPDDYYTHRLTFEAPKQPSFFERLRTHLAWRADKGADLSPDEIAGEARTICDIGCGSGRILRKFQSSGFRSVGVEPDPKAREAAEGSGVILNGTAENLPHELKDKAFDVVLMSHVLEHCADPSWAIANARKLIGDKGTLIIEVPNNEALGFSIFKACWPWTDIPRHLNFFTPKSLNAILAQNGLKVTRTIFLGYLIQFSPEWIEMQETIWRRVGDGKAPNFGLRAWLLLLKSAFAKSEKKYASIRVHAVTI